MGRARLLKPGFFCNELLAELPFEGRLLFAGLWTLADKAGRLEDRPRRIQASLFPWDEVDVSALLAALENKGFIDRYDVNGMPLIQIAKFSDHQTPHQRETESILPGPGGEPKKAKETDEPSKGSVEASPRSPVPIAVPIAVTGRIAANTSPPFLVFPTIGKPDTWGLHERQIVDWNALYAVLDIRAECRKALAWVQANMGRRKTARGMNAFLVNWFNRAVDRPGRRDVPVRETSSVSDWLCPHEPRCPHRTACAVVSARKAG